MHINAQDKQAEGEIEYWFLPPFISLAVRLVLQVHDVSYEGECVNDHCHIRSILSTTD